MESSSLVLKYCSVCGKKTSSDEGNIHESGPAIVTLYGAILNDPPYYRRLATARTTVNCSAKMCKMPFKGQGCRLFEDENGLFISS